MEPEYPNYVTNARNRPYAYDVTEGRPRVLGVKRGTATCAIAKHAAIGQPLHAIPPGWPGAAHWPRGWAPMRSASTTRARSVTSLDPQLGVVVLETWRQCIRSICICFVHPACKWAMLCIKKCTSVSKCLYGHDCQQTQSLACHFTMYRLSKKNYNRTFSLNYFWNC